MLNLNNHSILITGAAGNIGSNILDYIVDNFSNCKIIAIDSGYSGKKENLNYAIKNAKKNNNLIYIKPHLNVSKRDEVRNIFLDYSPQCVFHQASYLTLDTKVYRQDAIEANIIGFVNIIENCLAFKSHKLVFASSASVYGNPDIIPTPETHHFNNNKLLYGITKISNELIANYYADEEQMKIVGLRYFNVIGPRQSLSNIYTQIVPKWINSFKRGQDIVVYGDGTQTMDLISAKDIARFNVLAMQKEDLYRDIYNNFFGYLNVGSGKETSVLELLNIIKETITKLGYDTTKSKIIFQEHDPNLVKKRRADITLLREKLGEPIEDIKKTIEECVYSLLR